MEYEEYWGPTTQWLSSGLRRTASNQSTPSEHDPEAEQGEGKPTLMMLPYVAGIGED